MHSVTSVTVFLSVIFQLLDALTQNLRRYILLLAILPAQLPPCHPVSHQPSPPSKRKLFPALPTTPQFFVPKIIPGAPQSYPIKLEELALPVREL